MTFSCISFWKVCKELWNESWLINIWCPFKNNGKINCYLFTFNAALFRVLSWWNDDSLPWLKYWITAGWRNDGEGPLCRIDTTFSSAAKQQSLWFNTAIEPVGLPIEKRALSTKSRISVKETQNMWDIVVTLSMELIELWCEKIYWFKVKSSYIMTKIKIKSKVFC